MKAKLLHSLATYKAGEIIEDSEPTIDFLIAHGLAELVAEKTERNTVANPRKSSTAGRK